MKLWKLILIAFTNALIMGFVLNSCSAKKTSQTAKVEKSTSDPKDQTAEYRLSAYGNSWALDNEILTEQIVTKNGIEGFAKHGETVKTYFKPSTSGTIDLFADCEVKGQKVILKITLNKDSKIISLEKNRYENLFLGKFKVHASQYNSVDLEILEANNSSLSLETYKLKGNIADSQIFSVQDDFYWGRRGPSVHLGYFVPDDIKNVSLFYNEMTIPKGQDVVGSYFMANGFAEGYFGIQVNSKSERRILFSVWSPYHTDNPDEIPDSLKIVLLKKGQDVVINEFGNEGSGGQSFKRFDWKAGNTYKFVIKAHPSENNSTDYSAYFFAPEIGKWELIASFRRPSTSTYIKGPHSFLENFIPSMGDKSRRVYYANQWLYNGHWHRVTKARFTADATARKQSRMDYTGGVEVNAFYLQNCGFFSPNLEINSQLELENTEMREAPKIDINLFN